MTRRMTRIIFWVVRAATRPRVRSSTNGSIRRKRRPEPWDPPTDLGGSIEAYPKRDGAVVRAKYIQSALAAVPLLAKEYDVVAGGFLLRLSGLLTPDQAAECRAALAQVMGLESETVEP